MSFSNTDLLDAMMRAAFEPKSVAQAGYDIHGNPEVYYVPSPALIQPLIDVVKKKLEEDEGFRSLLIARVIERIDDVVDVVVNKINASDSPLSVARKERTGGFGSGREVSYELAEWLQEPLGKAMAAALTPAIRDHFAEGEQGLNFDSAQLNITVEVAPWPKKDAS